MKLSVVVTVVDGGPSLEACLDALLQQQDSPSLQVIVPWDASIPEAGALESRYPDFEFLSMGSVETERPVETYAAQHELFDRRRAAGLAMASGDLVGIVEDRGIPRADWASTGVRLHAELPHAVIGGVVENGVDSLLNWAIYFCDFSRYQPPVEQGPREWVTDVNVIYKRAALDSVRDLWAGRYHETTVHWELLRRGETLYLSPDLSVEQQRKDLHIRELLSERREWGRLFAYTRARELSLPRRIAYLGASPVLPSMLLLRHGRTQLAKRHQFLRYLRATPAVALLLTSWSIGEAEGYLGRGP